jgi:hypothetical protein
VEEAMIGFKGRFFLKQYLPRKPTKWGIKAWGLADSANGYFLKCDIYKGKKEIWQQDLLLGEQVVLHLTENFWGKWHHIYFDNFFSSTNLMKNAIGTRNVQLWCYVLRRSGIRIFRIVT